MRKGLGEKIAQIDLFTVFENAVYLIFVLCMFLFQDNHESSSYMLFYGLGAIIIALNVMNLRELELYESKAAMLAVFCFLAFATLTLFTGPSIQLPAYKMFLFGVAMFFAFSIKLANIEARNAFVKIVAIAASILAVYFLLNMTSDLSIVGRTKVAGLNVINVSVVMAIGSLSAIYVSSFTGRKAWLLLLPLFYAVVLLSGSKLGLASSIFMPLVYFFFADSNLFRRLGVIALAFVVVSVVYYLVTNVPELYNVIGYRVEGLAGLLFGDDTSSEDAARGTMISLALQIFSQNPIIGAGFDCFRVVNGWTNTWSHCNYAEIAANFGLIGFILYYSRYVCLIAGFSKVKGTRSKETYYSISLILGFLLLESGIVVYYTALYQILLAFAFASVGSKLPSAVTLRRGERG